ncbi:MAG: L-threonylcarbamoyladenylate synthase [Acidimicrobiales bacterium]
MDVISPDDRSALDRTVSAILRGGLVVLPTDTVYGLAIRPGDSSALARLLDAKARPRALNLPVLVASLDEVGCLGADLGETGRILAEKFWPGAMTLVLAFSPGARRPAWLEGRAEVAVRIPAHRFVTEVIAGTGPLLVTSANIHGEPTPAGAGEAAACLRLGVDLVVDDGLLKGEASTLVNLRAEPAVIERLGALDPAQLSALGISLAGPEPGTP